MSLLDTLLSIFTDKDEYEAYEENPSGYLTEHGYGDVTAQQIQAEMPRVLAAAQGNTGGATQGGFANFAGSGNVVLPPPPPPSGDGGAAEGGLSGAVEAINHYTNVLNVNQQSFEDNDTTVINDNDEIIDNSVNQNITAFGDVHQDFDNDVVTGDGNALGGDDSVVNSGDGAVQNTGTIADSTIATGDVGGSVTGDNYDSIVGDGNQVIDDSIVGAASFGEGDATNVVAQNANVGDGTQVVGGYGETNVNTGEGDLIDANVNADDGSAVSFGDGSYTSAENQDVDIEDNYGTVQVAGDESNQLGATDNSVNDSFNADIDVDASTNDSYNDQSDDDGLDLDVDLGGAPADDPGPIEAV